MATQQIKVNRNESLLVGFDVAPGVAVALVARGLADVMDALGFL